MLQHCCVFLPIIVVLCIYHGYIFLYLSGGGLSLGVKSTAALPKLGTLPATTMPTLGGLGAKTTAGGVKLGGLTTTSAATSTKGLGGVDSSTTTGAGKTTG